METFNIWNELSDESREHIINTNKEYLNHLKTIYDKDSIEYYEYCAKIRELENMFGYNNINPKPKYKNWDDIVKKYKDRFDINIDNISNTLFQDRGYCDDKVIKRLIAEYKIAKIITLGYGGLCTIDDVEGNGVFNFEYKVVINYNTNTTSRMIDIEYSERYLNFLSFRTKELAEEFWDNNEDLVNDYFMI